ncbi:L,D-transpeptidase family protein [Fodinibacter luteus]|uniref:L,D-transpeptidase family protein n=2 Tax=Fodinibacter luteus TaxID=552064 RepID=A0ABP8KFD0_9MICO
MLLTAAVAVPMVLGGAGTAYAAHYQDRALPGSAVAGVPVAGLTRAEVEDIVRERAADVAITIEAGEASRAVTLTDLGYTVDVDATVDAVLAANKSWSSYATSLLSDRDVDAVVRTDPAVAEAVAADLVGKAGKAGSDARVELSKKKTSFRVVPAVQGHTVEADSFQDVVAAAARDLSSATATVRFTDVTPDVTTAEAEEAAAAANAIVKRKVVVSDGEDEHAASARAKASWVTIPSADGSLGAPQLDAKKIRSWVDSLAKDAKVTPRSGMRNVAPSGSVLTVVKKARDGRSVTNAAAVATAAAEAVAAGRAYAGDFEYETVEATWTDRVVAPGAERLAYPAAPGEKWIDVDLGSHTMTAYVGADVVYGPISMVNGAPETPTVAGTFRVYHKNPMMTMRGNNADGSPYETPNVPWSTFFHRGYALHGAPWRSSFGYTGSHGCVNLPVGAAKWVYDFATVGTAVVSHR